MLNSLKGSLNISKDALNISLYQMTTRKISYMQVLTTICYTCIKINLQNLNFKFLLQILFLQAIEFVDFIANDLQLTAPICIKQFWRLLELNRNILANQVGHYNLNNCFNCNVNPDWPELAGWNNYPINFFIQFSAERMQMRAS